MNKYQKIINNIINDIETKESSNIKEAAKIFLNAIKKEEVIHVFATGHSHMFAEELFYRAGGIVQIDPILKPFLMQHEGAISSTKYERLSGIAKIIYEGLDLKKGEPFVIVSNSGVNSVPIEMAQLVKENGHPLIVVTSMDTSKNINKEKHLYDYADVLIDNHTSYGDASIQTKYGNIAPTSTIASAYIANRIVIDTISMCEEEGISPSIYMSANIGGDDHNKELVKKYRQRIKGLN